MQEVLHHFHNFLTSRVEKEMRHILFAVQHGHLILPHSRDDSAWGAIRIPICVARRGTGPTALITGGNHGDEYEGPIALYELARTLRPEDVTGRVIVLPALNFPAFEAATRTSPLDGGNLNRLFPGRPDGTPTQKIADYVARALVPLADVVLDFHSGGKTLEFLPFAAAHRLPDARHEAACKAAVEAFGAPYSMTMREIDAVGMLDTVVEEMGKTFVTTELGGGGGVLEPVQAVGQNHQVDHRGQQEQEDALRHEHAAGVENEPDLVELSHELLLPQNQGAQMYVAR